MNDIAFLKEDLKIYYIDTYLQLTFMHFSSFIAIRDQFTKQTIFSEATSFFSQIRNGLPYFLDPIVTAVKNQDIPLCIEFSKETLPAYYKCFLLLKRLINDVAGKDFDLMFIN